MDLKPGHNISSFYLVQNSFIAVAYLVSSPVLYEFSVLLSTIRLTVKSIDWRWRK